MKDNEVIKMLEKCKKISNDISTKFFYNNVLDLINKQKAKIDGLECRISALNETNQRLMDSQEIHWKNCVKEFAERLKIEYEDENFGRYMDWKMEECIEKLVKEMTGSESYALGRYDPYTDTFLKNDGK